MNLSSICEIMRKLVPVIILFFSLNASAQTTLGISGTIIDSNTKLPIELASVQLLQDSIVVKATATDRKGKFMLEKVTPGKYVLAFTFIGYEKRLDTVNVAGQKVNTGVIALSSSSKQLKTVVVLSRKSLLNSSIDRKIYNVGQDVMSGSGSASDILTNIPSVEVDIDGNISLRGSTEVMILINGKPSPQMGKSRAEVLEQMPANTIERIEVITNPSAKYLPDGTSGIINLVMKKNSKTGFNGSAIANAGNKDRYNGSISLNYSPGRINLYGNYAIRRDNRSRMNIINRQQLDSTGKIQGYYDEPNQSLSKPLGHKATIGAEYALDLHNCIGGSLNYSYRFMKKEDVVNKYFYNLNHDLIQQYDRLRYDPETEIEKDATIFWQYNFNIEGHEIRFEYNKAIQDEVEDNHYTNVYKYPLAPNSYDNTLIKHSENLDHFAIDYSRPISENSRLELGYDGSFTLQKPVYYGEFYDITMNKFVKDPMKTNNFIYEQAINALYATYQYNYSKFGYLAGLRMEQSDIDATLVTKDSVITNNFFKLYPTIHLSYKLPHGDIQLNYSSRVYRPEADDLNPFPEYRDPRNLRVGNPKLLPEITNSVELGYKYQDDKVSFVPSLYYSYKQYAFTEVITKLDDSTLLTTQQNLSNDQSSGLELIFSAKPAKFFSVNLNANFFYNTIDASSLGFSSKKSIVSMSATFNTIFAITSGTMLQISSNYRSAQLTPQGKLYASFVFNSGLRQDLFKKKISITLTGSDLLRTLEQKTELNTSFLNQTIMSKRDAQILYLGVSYHFGKLLKKSNEEKMQFDNSL